MGNIDDVWTYQKVGTPFPSNVQKAPGQANKYIALWYKHGKPVMGKAWNDSGVVKCAFVYDSKVYTSSEIGGQIQLLVHDSNNKTFYYDWILYEEAKKQTKPGVFEMVRCGISCAVFWPEEELLGNLDIEKHISSFADDKDSLRTNSANLEKMLVLCKILGQAPVALHGLKTLNKKATLRMPLIVNDWEDFNWGSEWPTSKPVMSAPKKSEKDPEQYVALWYRHGKPVMGRAWNSKNRIDASFVDSNREFSGATVGSLQLLMRLPPTSVGYDYVWLPYDQAMDYRDKDFLPVHLSYTCPAIIPVNGVPYLGQVDMKLEKATVACYGTVTSLEGGQVKSILVLCRKEHEETMLV
ncbi:unnamed protein product [Caenorhabditis angaria]|uniref:Uncharacterized protein n=1 Tax=Caenorhabditis angaria TaxID=860376 RepID=A0A9P1IAE2_9PELO|nr:unnamed protein product [Caenorhabditis angaria]